MKPHDRQFWRCHLPDGVRALRHALRRVYNYVRDAPLAFHGERRLPVLFAEPALMSEFEGCQKRVHALGTVFNVRNRLRRRGHPMRELEQHRPQFAGDVQRLQRLEEARPQFVHNRRRHVLVVDVLLAGVRQLALQVLGEKLRLRLVSREEPERLATSANRAPRSPTTASSVPPPLTAYATVPIAS